MNPPNEMYAHDKILQLLQYVRKLTHSGRDKMAAIFAYDILKWISWMKMINFD